MAKTSENRMRLLKVKEIFEKYTDEENPVTVPDIIKMLEREGINADRRSVYDDMEALQLFGMDIVRRKTRTYDYYLGTRDFELAELKLMVDAVQASRFITKKKSGRLIKKIEGLAGISEAKQLDRHVYIVNRVKSVNESIYYNIDELHRAISAKKQIKFQYSEYTLGKKLVPRRNGEYYTVSPYMLAWDNENYYLIAFHERYHSITHFRVDKMSRISIDAEDCRPFPEMDLAEYARKTFGMFPGEEEDVVVEFDSSLIGVVIDRFGKDIIISSQNAERFTVRLHIFVSNVFLSWIFQFGDRARIVSPSSVRESMRELVKKVECLY